MLFQLSLFLGLGGSAVGVGSSLRGKILDWLMGWALRDRISAMAYRASTPALVELRETEELAAAIAQGAGGKYAVGTGTGI
jgi:hypothetical protein